MKLNEPRISSALSKDVYVRVYAYVLACAHFFFFFLGGGLYFTSSLKLYFMPSVYYLKMYSTK